MFIPTNLSTFRTEGTIAELTRTHEVELSAKLLTINYLHSPEYGYDWVIECNNSVSKNGIDADDFYGDYDDINPKISDITNRFEDTLNSLNRMVLLDFVNYVNLMFAHGYLTELQKEEVLSYKDWVDDKLGDIPEAKFIFA